MTNLNEPVEAEQLTCLDRREDRDECRGTVEFRPGMSGTGRRFPRCDFHWEKRVELQDRLRHDYGVDSSPGVRPAWDFDESYAGERWDEEY